MRLTLPLLSCLVLTGPAAFAEPSATRAVGELVVSTFRPVRAQELDTSLTLLDTQTIRQATLTNFEDIVGLVPNLNRSGEGSRARYFQLRGIGEREQYEGAPNPSVGFIVDDIDLSGIGGVGATFDIDRVEVLRGPQSARYGSSALAGVIYLQSAMPERDYGLRAEVGIGSEDTRSAGVAVTGGLSERVSGRLSVYRYGDNGFRDNAFTGRDDTNERRELTVRGKLRAEFDGGWDALASVLHADYANRYDAFALDNGDVTFSDEPGRDAQETTAASLRITGPVGRAADLVSITSVAQSDIFFSYDGDWVNENFWLPIVYDYRYENPRDRDTLTQEFRLVSNDAGRIFGGTTDWVTGVSWQRLEESNRITSTGDYVDSSVGCDPGVCITDRRVRSDYTADTVALFGALDANLGGGWALSAGLRLERWAAEYGDAWTDASVFTPVMTSNRFTPDEDLLGGHLAVSYDWTPLARSYLRIARGFKSGGFNPSLAALGALPDAPGPEFVPYRREYLWNYELGLKLNSADNRAELDASLFLMERDDAQLSQSAQADLSDPNTFFFTTSNGEASVYGLELAARYQLGEHWELQGTLGLLDTKIEEWRFRPAVVGRDLAHAPDYTASVALAWRNPADYFFRVDVQAVDDFYFDISHDGRSEAYTLVNLRFGRDWEHWSVSVWGRNIFDEDYATRGFFFGNEPPDFAPKLYTRFGDPRQVGIGLRYRY